MAKKESFHSLLVLNHWMLGFFYGASFAKLQERLRDPRLEGVNEETGQTKFFHELTNYLFDVNRIPENVLRRYDLNIIGYWNRITVKRNVAENTVMRMKYFQYLSLLFTEIYFDWYFNHHDALLAGLNKALAAFNEPRETADGFQRYLAEELNKIAFWNATGSGKTLLLHINILQYRHYQKGKIDKIILLTPNEGLSRQHLLELDRSGLSGHLFTESNDLFSQSGQAVEIIDINKLADEKGEKTFAVESFEGRNLVLVDEGHRGTSGGSGGEWLKRREYLCKDGFSIEYSATFGQAVSGGKNVEALKYELQREVAKRKTPKPTKREISDVILSEDDVLELRRKSVKESYAKCVLFDYSYKFFYEDGYGKESLILNLKDDDKPETNHKYLTACLLSFYQQQYLFRTHAERIADFKIEKPLWIFVGNKVQDDDGDILAILKFFARFVNHAAESIHCIRELKNDQALLLDPKGHNVFSKRFVPIYNRDENEIFSDVLHTVFNSESCQRLKLLVLKNGTGELGLQLGSNTPFGVINIGDPEKFAKMCLENSELISLFDTEPEDAFGNSLFNTINDKESKVNVLIGSRKFTEGWSSWRVSTMGLMNMGRGEGSQIIQLFGRGVRLKGRNYSLQRSRQDERPEGCFLQMLETLNIFGIRADYMAQFKDYLREEGVTPSDEILEVEFVTQRNSRAGRLKTLRLKDGYKNNQASGFKRTTPVTLFEVPKAFAGKIKPANYTLDLYPKIEALRSNELKSATQDDDKKTIKMPRECFCFFNWDKLYRELMEFKAERCLFNIRLDKRRLVEFCTTQDDWYTLLAPPEEFQLRGFSDIQRFEEVLGALLLGYTDKFYETLQNAYESQFLEYVTLADDDPSLLASYRFEIDEGDEGRVYFERLNKLKALVESKEIGEINKWSDSNMVAICFDRHLYYPLMHIADPKSMPLKMRPIGLVESEHLFVMDLMAFYNSPDGEKFFKNKDLYLMRNASSKDKGVGFALAGNFYPDFMLWLIDGDKQYLTFIDPKGIRQVDLGSAKLKLYKEIKKLEKDLGDGDIILNSFILSMTKFADLLNNSQSPSQLESKHILFLEDGGPKYLPKMFSLMK